MRTAARQLQDLIPEAWSDLAVPCRTCTFWESASSSGGAAPGKDLQRKRDWVADTREQWGPCGLVLRVDELAVGYATYAPPAYLPRAGSFPTSPASPDCVILAAVWVAPAHRGRDVGRVLVQGVTADLVRRGVRAVEAFGGGAPARPASRVRRAGTAARSCEQACVLPTAWLQSCGFTVVRPHPTSPRLRLDVRSLATTWREDVESAVERLRPGARRAAVPARMDG